MSEGLNRVMCLGNLGSDPELKVTSGGQSVLKLRLACSESYLNRDNERQERTEWVSGTVWGKRAEALAKILHKGDRIYVEGGLRTSSYEKDGEKRYRTEVNVTNVILCGGGKRRDDDAEERPARKAEAPAAANGGDAGGDDEIPF